MNCIENILADIKQLIDNKDKVLLAVSGGVDSMVMLNIFVKYFPETQIGIAHCNFSLRAEDSNKDMKLVEKIANKYDVEFYKVIFDTYNEMNLRGKNLQETARELRYEWFETISKEFGFTKIATAHNTNDTIETFFVNCIRGTGIRGLGGIPVTNGKIIRPIIGLTRDEIVEYANINNIEFREDLSNSTTKYLRNSIRHNIIPLFVKRNENFTKIMYENIERIKESVDFLDHTVKQYENELMETKNGVKSIDLEKLVNIPKGEYLLYEILHKSEFSKTTTNSIYNCFLNKSSGKIFYSKTHTAYLNRTVLEVMEQLSESFFVEVSKDALIWEVGNDVFLQKVQPYKKEMNLKSDNYTAFLDYDKLEQTLQIRNWNHGDSFYPFGMKQSKQLSDFFINNKISISKKNRYPIVCSGENIVWIAALRSDNRYAVTPETKKVLISKYIPKND